MRWVLLAIVLLGWWSVARAVEYSTVEFAGQKFTVCKVDVKKERLQVFHRDEKGQAWRRFDPLAASLAAHGRKLVFAMNGGMYHVENFNAVGLFVTGGRELVPLNLAPGEGNFFLKPNGVFAVTERGAKVVDAAEYPQVKEKVLEATQSGPLLVKRGQLHPAFKRESTSRLFRNGVGVPSPETALFVISEGPINLYEFATLFRDQLKCPDALFLDGTISSLYATALKRDDFRMDLGPMIGVTE